MDNAKNVIQVVIIVMVKVKISVISVQIIFFYILFNTKKKNVSKNVQMDRENHLKINKMYV